MQIPLLNFILLSRSDLNRKISLDTVEALEQIIAEMGAEIHDDLIQKLTLLELDIQRIQRSHQDPEELKGLITKMETDYKIIINSVRRISRKLMPVSYEGDSFSDQIELLCQNMEHPGASHIHFEKSGIEQILQPVVTRHLYRMVQELMHNALRHSSAWHIWTRLQWGTNQLVIEVEDDGTAFTKMKDVVNQLKQKNNSLRMRSEASGSNLTYHQGKEGLLAKIHFTVNNSVVPS